MLEEGMMNKATILGCIFGHEKIDFGILFHFGLQALMDQLLS